MTPIFQAQARQKIDRDTVLDMPDRIVAATAQQLGLPLITKDPAIASIPGLAVTW
ncbi:MAG: PIN domain-containing protein [Anaerolineae bacterium]